MRDTENLLRLQIEEQDEKIEKLEKELRFAKNQVANALSLYDEARQDADSALKSKGEFFSKLSHEFRTPMNALMGYSNLLIKRNESEATTRYASGIKSATNRLLNLFNDLIEVSRMESGLIVTENEEYETGVLINTIMDSFSNEIKEKGLLMKLDFDEELPSKMYGDFYHLRQIICNLIDNAVKYTDKGYVSVDIKAEKGDGISDVGRKLIQLTFSVKDTGKGIRKQDKDKLFKVFSQFNSKNPYANQGAGVGLTVAKFYSNRMHGNITFESNYGEGSTFTCTVMQEIVDETPIREKYSYDGNNMRQIVFTAPETQILIVDDSMVNLNVAKGLLEEYEVNADIADGGYEALKMIDNRKYDIIFMDHMMPDIDGIETMHKIKEKGDWCRFVPVIALTANATDEARQLFRQEGFQDFLAKPIETGLLRDILLKWIPNEKIVFSDISHGYASKEKSVANTAKTVFTKTRLLQEGIDLEAGLSYFGGNIKAYRDTMKDILMDCTKKVFLIEKYLAEEDLKNFAIEAHSVKSVAATIGADAFSGIAKECELKAKAGDKEYVKEHGSYFVRRYVEFLSSIESLLQEERSLENEEKQMEEKPETGEEHLSGTEIKNVIHEAIAALDDYEADIAAGKIKLLLSQKNKVDIVDKLYKTQELIDDFEYEQAVMVLKEVAGGLKD